MDATGNFTPTPTLIGAAILAIPDGATIFGASVLRQAIEAAINRDQVGSACWGHLCVTAFVVVTFQTADRAAALRSVRDSLAELGLGKSSMVAYWNEDELVWHPVHRGIPARFEDFVSESVLLEAEARVQAVSRMVQDLDAAAQSMQAENGGLGL